MNPIKTVDVRVIRVDDINDGGDEEFVWLRFVFDFRDVKTVMEAYNEDTKQVDGTICHLALEEEDVVVNMPFKEAEKQYAYWRKQRDINKERF